MWTFEKTASRVDVTESMSLRSEEVLPTFIARTPSEDSNDFASRKNSFVVRCQGIYGSLYASTAITLYLVFFSL